MPPTLDFVVQPRLAPSRSLAADEALLAGVRDRSRAGALRVYDLAGDVLALGRYHVAPGDRGAGVTLWRRRSGGRALPWGDGFVGLSLVLPHRSAPFAPEPLALRAEQVLNRHVRGILGACEAAGVSAFYPGRDAVTVGGRLLAMVSLEVDASGALVVEAVVAVGRPFAELPALLERADPAGVVGARMIGPDETTCLAALLGRDVGTAELAAWLRHGFEGRLGLAFAERDAVPDVPFDAEAWLRARSLRAGLERRASVETQLGVLDVHMALEGDRIRDVMLAGDFIANSPAIDALERALRECPAERAAVAATVVRVLAEPGNFVLGVGSPDALATAIVRGLGA